MSGLDEHKILTDAILVQHAYRIHLASREIISYEQAKTLVKSLIQEYDLANEAYTSDESEKVCDNLHCKDGVVH